MNRQRLYGNLIRSVYVLKGIDGEFVASLCEQIPFKPKAYDWAPSGVLATIPANQVARALRNVSTARRNVTRHRKLFAQKIEAGLIDCEDYSTTTEYAFEKLMGLLDQRDSAEDTLAELV